MQEGPPQAPSPGLWRGAVPGSRSARAPPLGRDSTAPPADEADEADEKSEESEPGEPGAEGAEEGAEAEQPAAAASKAPGGDAP